MIWSAYFWVWQVEQPLYIGMPPAKSLNRCRLYLPARAMHGAITAELARINFDENPQSLSEPAYGKFGREIGIWCRFTYLYPTIKPNNRFEVWLPEFVLPRDRNSRDEQGQGLCWRVGEGRPTCDRDFRRCLLSTKASTAISPDSDAALDGSLHETEYINTRWRPFDRNAVSSQVYFAGYVFLKDNAFLQKLQNVKTLWVGGDSRYGLGKIQRVEWKKLQDNIHIFGAPVGLDLSAPLVKTNHVLAHAYSNLSLRGMKELVGGWNINEPWIRQRQELPAWSPGSSTCEGEQYWMIDTYGIWRGSSDGAQTGGSE